MKLEVDKTQLNQNPIIFLKRLGWGYILDRKTQKSSLVKRLTRNYYPRLHAYVKTQGEKYIFDIHLDHKQTSYQGQPRHNADYDHEAVQAEINKIKSQLGATKSQESSPQSSHNSVDSELEGDLETDEDRLKTKNKSWWKRIFNI